MPPSSIQYRASAYKVFSSFFLSLFYKLFYEICYFVLLFAIHQHLRTASSTIRIQLYCATGTLLQRILIAWRFELPK
jgi:hypothetical protein